MKVTQPTWGQALVLALYETKGVTPVVDSIQAVLGKQVGTRNSFAKLQNVEDVSDLRGKDEYRAWLLLIAIGEEPADWGVSDPDMQGPIVETMREMLSPVSDSNRRPPLYIVGGLADEMTWPAEAAKIKTA